MATFNKLEDIIAWQKAKFFCLELKQLFPTFLQKKEFEILNQLKKSSGSVMDNIAEGFGRMGNGEFKHFLTIAHGSIMEAISQLSRSFDWDVISNEQYKHFKGLADEVQRLVFSLINHLIQTELKGVKFK